jgi:hypothetical protein
MLCNYWLEKRFHLGAWNECALSHTSEMKWNTGIFPLRLGIYAHGSLAIQLFCNCETSKTSCSINDILICAVMSGCMPARWNVCVQLRTCYCADKTNNSKCRELHCQCNRGAMMYRVSHIRRLGQSVKTQKIINNTVGKKKNLIVKVIEMRLIMKPTFRGETA